MASKRVSFYIDGFNLYYGRLKANPALRWLDPDALARRLRPHDTVHVRYFTARARAQPDPVARDHQRLYLRALDARPSISVHYRRFRTHPKFMALVNPLPGRPRIVEVRGPRPRLTIRGTAQRPICFRTEAAVAQSRSKPRHN